MPDTPQQTHNTPPLLTGDEWDALTLLVGTVLRSVSFETDPLRYAFFNALWLKTAQWGTYTGRQERTHV